jgi:hypothetical protein
MVCMVDSFTRGVRYDRKRATGTPDEPASGVAEQHTGIGTAARGADDQQRGRRAQRDQRRHRIGVVQDVTFDVARLVGRQVLVHDGGQQPCRVPQVPMADEMVVAVGRPAIGPDVHRPQRHAAAQCLGAAVGRQRGGILVVVQRHEDRP